MHRAVGGRTVPGCTAAAAGEQKPVSKKRCRRSAGARCARADGLAPPIGAVPILFREALLFRAARVRLVSHRHPAYSGRPNTSSRSMRPRTVWKPRGTRGRGQARAKARETRIGRNSCLVRSSEIGANLADFLAGTERKSGWLKDSGSHLLFDRVQKFALQRTAGQPQ